MRGKKKKKKKKTESAPRSPGRKAFTRPAGDSHVLMSRSMYASVWEYLRVRVHARCCYLRNYVAQNCIVILLDLNV